MAREDAAAVAVAAHQPGKGVNHRALGIAGALEQRHRMTIGLEFQWACVVIADQSASDRGNSGATGHQLFQQSGSNAQAGAEDLGFDGMTEVFVGDFMGEDAAQLIVGGPIQ